MRKKARVLHRAISRITREVRRNPLGCSKDVFENADSQEREWSGQKIMVDLKVDFQTVLFIDECRPTLDGPDGRRKRWYCKNQGHRWGPRPHRDRY